MAPPAVRARLVYVHRVVVYGHGGARIDKPLEVPPWVRAWAVRMESVTVEAEIPGRRFDEVVLENVQNSCRSGAHRGVIALRGRA